MPITYRLEKGSPLTNLEVDDNFRDLDQRATANQQAASSAAQAAAEAGGAAGNIGEALNTHKASGDHDTRYLRRDVPDSAPLLSGIAQTGVTGLPFELDALRTALNYALYGDGPYPSRDFRFIGASKLAPEIQCVAPTERIYYDIYGVRRVAGINEPRFESPALGQPARLLREEASTNQVTNSETPWTNSTVRGASVETGIYAGYPMSRFVPNTDVNTHNVQTSFANSSVAGTKHSVQLVLRAGGAPGVRVQTFSGSGVPAFTANVEFVGGGIVVSGASGPVRYRRLADDVWLLMCDGFSTGEGAVSNLVRILLWDPVEGTTVAGNDIDGFWHGGVSWEVGAAYCSSYIPTNGAAASRAAEVLSISGADFAKFYNRASSTFLVDVTPTGIGGSATNKGSALAVDNGGFDEMLNIRLNEAGVVVGVLRSAGAAAASGGMGSYTLGARQRIAAAYDKAGAIFSLNGQTAVSVAPAVTPAADRLWICGAGINSISGLQGYINRVAYWPSRIPEAQLNQWTQA